MSSMFAVIKQVIVTMAFSRLDTIKGHHKAVKSSFYCCQRLLEIVENNMVVVCVSLSFYDVLPNQLAMLFSLEVQ